MNRTRIEWCDFTINPVKGKCPVDCKDNQGKSYCYARRMYDRFQWNPEIRLDNPPIKMPSKPSRIFVGSTIELFGDWIKPQWLEWLFGSIREHKKHTFIFLAKQPQNLAPWSPFPDNCWVGASVVSNGSMTLALTNLANVKAGLKFISFEPLLGYIEMNDHMKLSDAGIGWAIIGQRTPVSKRIMPRIEWIRDIVQATDKEEVPVFLKDNLRPLFQAQLQYLMDTSWGVKEWVPILRQEFPKVAY